jgi:hypothetical protein
LTKLIIDDLRILNLPGDVRYARNLKDAFTALASDEKWEEIYLDHDLGLSWTENDEIEDIWPVVDYFQERLAENPIKTGQIFIITSNPVGRQRMKLAFDKMGYPTTVLDPQPLLGGILPW